MVTNWNAGMLRTVKVTEHVEYEGPEVWVFYIPKIISTSSTDLSKFQKARNRNLDNQIADTEFVTINRPFNSDAPAAIFPYVNQQQQAEYGAFYLKATDIGTVFVVTTNNGITVVLQKACVYCSNTYVVVAAFDEDGNVVALGPNASSQSGSGGGTVVLFTRIGGGSYFVSIPAGNIIITPGEPEEDPE